jgi:dienelactone hydrolase
MSTIHLRAALRMSIPAAALLALASTAFAQPAGITPEMIGRQLPLEGAPLAVEGPYKVMSEGAYNSPGHTVYRPEMLEAFPKKDTLPVMVWGNGGCAIENKRYGGFLSTIASHGFLVLATAAQPSDAVPAAAGKKGPGRRSANADDLRAAIDWAAKENARMGSPLMGKIALDKIAVMGQSCGGFLSITLGADPRVKTIGVFNSGVQLPAGGVNSTQPMPDALAALHGPVLLINGHEPDFMLAASLATYDKITTLPTFYGARHNAGHTATVFHPGGGEYANVASNWLLYTFKKDKKAGKMFVGKSCDLCKLDTWDVKAKNLK